MAEHDEQAPSLPGALQQARVTHLQVGGEELYVLSVPLPRRREIEGLTAAERAVLELLWQGRTTSEIAAQRGRRYRTVANQLASIYAKAGVTTREELIASLTCSAP